MDEISRLKTLIRYNLTEAEDWTADPDHPVNAEYAEKRAKSTDEMFKPIIDNYMANRLRNGFGRDKPSDLSLIKMALLEAYNLGYSKGYNDKK